MKSLKFLQALVIGISAFSIGFLLILQFRSFTKVQQAFLRDRDPNIFREIRILKDVTDRLRKEKADLSTKKEEFASNISSLESFRKEFEKEQLLSGEIQVKGPGIRLELPLVLETSWFTDMMNDLVTAGAEAITINGIRIGPDQVGFRAVNSRTLLLGNRVLRPPFRIEAIGDKHALKDALLQPGSVLRRLEQARKNQEIRLIEQDALIFDAIRGLNP